MAVFRAGTLVLFHSKTAVVKGIANDKIEIGIEGGGTKNVREKDIEWLHAGPVSALPPKRLPDPDMGSVIELMETETLPFREFTELLYSENSPEAAYSACLLLKDDLYFTGSVADGVRVKPKDEIEKKLAVQREKAEAKARYDARIERIRKRALLPEDLPFMSEIEQVAYGINSASRLMKDAGIEALPDKAHRLLLDLGVWTYRNNPFPARFGADQPDPELPEPEILPAEMREDLTYMNAYAIDDDGSGDPDDAVSYDNGILWIHIADPASFATPDSELDLAARERGSNLYLPEKVTRMLPGWITDLCGLGLHETSPAMSFAVRIDPENGEAALDRVVLSTVRVQRYTYESAASIWDNPDMTEMRVQLEKFRAYRERNGALFIRLPEVKIHADENGHVSITPVELTPEREFVANAMLAAGAGTAKWAEANHIPMPFAVQDPPDMTGIPDKDQSLPQMYALRRACLASSVTSLPGRHAGLGLEPYVRVTSPLRRYSDLLAHQQIRRVLAGLDPFDEDVMDGILAKSEPAAYARNRAERFSNEYWTLVFMMQQGEGWQTDAVAVFQQNDRHVYLLPELAYEYKNRFGGKVEPGESLRVQLQKADPVSLLARMRLVFPGREPVETESEAPEETAGEIQDADGAKKGDVEK